jgi:putative ABC transport system substrate-binding protein
MGPKRVELAHQLVPNAGALAMLINSKFPMALAEMRDMQAAARSLGLQVTVVDAHGESEIDPAPLVHTDQSNARTGEACYQSNA